MTQENQDAVIGRIVREKKQAENQLVLLRAEADKLGSILVELGQMLKVQPEHVAFQDQPVIPRFSRAVRTYQLLDSAKIAKLTHDIRDEVAKVEELGSRAAKIGI